MISFTGLDEDEGGTEQTHIAALASEPPWHLSLPGIWASLQQGRDSTPDSTSSTLSTTTTLPSQIPSGKEYKARRSQYIRKTQFCKSTNIKDLKPDSTCYTLQVEISTASRKVEQKVEQMQNRRLSKCKMIRCTTLTASTFDGSSILLLQISIRLATFNG